MTTQFLPLLKPTFFDNDGVVLAGGKVESFLAGTSTQTNTFSDRAGNTPNTNPVVLDSAGRANIYLDKDIRYKFVVSDADDVVLYTVDQVYTDAGDIEYDPLVTYAAGSVGSALNDVDAFIAGLDASQVSFTQDGSVVTRTVEAKLNEYISVKDFGAVGDGVTDDTLAIQAALDQVNSTSGGAVIYFPNGTYKCTNLSLSGKKGVTLMGETTSVYSVIQISGKITCSNTGDFFCSNLMFVGSTFNMTTRVLDSAPVAGNYLFDMVDNCANWNLVNNQFYGFDVVFRPNSGATNGSYVVKIQNNRFEWNNKGIHAYGILHWNINSNVFSEDYVCDLHIVTGAEFSISDNKFENSTNALSLANIYLGDGSTTNQMFAVIHGNTFHQCYGFVFSKVQNVVFTDNVTRLPKVADTFAVTNSQQITISNNQLYGYDGTYRRYGLYMAGCEGGIIVSNNSIQGFDTAVYVSTDYSCIISGNVLAAQTECVHVTGCTTARRLIVQENTCSGSIVSVLNTNYWTERFNRMLGGSLTNTDGYMDIYYQEGSWTPVPTSLTVTGTPTYSGTYVKNGRSLTCYATISISGGNSTCAQGTTYFTGMPYPASYDSSVLSVDTGANAGGIGLVTGTKAYPAAWSTKTEMRLSMTYEV